MSATDERLSECGRRAPFHVGAETTWVTWVTPVCTLEPHDATPDQHRAETAWGVFMWHANPPLQAIVTVENQAGGILDRWSQEEGSAVTRELVGEPATIAVAVVRA